MPFRKHGQTTTPQGTESEDTTISGAETPAQGLNIPSSAPSAPGRKRKGQTAATRRKASAAADAAPVGSGPAEVEWPLADLLTRLGDENPAIRLEAARLLEGRTEAIPALVARLKVEGDRGIRESLALVLSRAESHQTVASVLPLLRERDADLRSHAAEILNEHATGLEPLLPVLVTDLDPGFRVQVLTILKSLKLNDLNALIHDVLTREDDVNVVAAALDIVHGRMTEMNVPELQTLAEAVRARFDQHPFIDYALRRITLATQSPQR